MMSVVIEMSGRTARSLRSFCLYSSTVWPRFIAASTRSEPLCTGRCSKLLSFGTLAYASIKLSLNSSGWEVVKRMRSTPGTAAAKWIRVARSATAAVVHLTRVGVDVLSEQRHFAHALRRQRLDLAEHLRERPADLLAPRVGYDAEGAVLAAALHDGDESRGTVCSRLGQAVEFLDLRKAHVDLRPARSPQSLDHLREPMQGLRTEHQIHVRSARGDALALLAGHTTAHADDHVRPQLLERAPFAEQREHLFLGLLPHGAGVDQQHVRLRRIVRTGHPVGRLEHIPHLAGIVLVHLTAEGFDVDKA